MYKVLQIIRNVRRIRRVIPILLLALVAGFGMGTLNAANNNFFEDIYAYVNDPGNSDVTASEYNKFQDDYYRYQDAHPDRDISIFEFSTIYDSLGADDYKRQADSTAASDPYRSSMYMGEMTEEEKQQLEDYKFEMQLQKDYEEMMSLINAASGGLSPGWVDREKNRYDGNDLRGKFSVAPIFYGDTTGEKGYYGYGLSLDYRLHGKDKVKSYDMTRPSTGSLLVGFDITNGFGPVNNQIQTTLRLGYSYSMVSRGFRDYARNGVKGYGYKNWYQLEGSLLSLRYNFTTKTLYVPLEFGFYWNNRFGDNPDKAWSMRLGFRVGFDLFSYDFEAKHSEVVPFDLSYGAYIGFLF